ncbi:MAG: DUF5063 domain-containing protein [Bacteroidales bacterium]|jgi:hypothetical protein
MSIQNNPVYSKDVLEFVTIANEYSRFVEQSDAVELREFIDRAHKILPLLYLKASLLPELDSKYESMNQKFVNEQDYGFIRDKMLKKLGQYDSYEEVFTPLHDESDEAIGASISEDMADVYQDIKDFVLLYEIGTEDVMYEAIWECAQNFRTYWGQRLTNALRALHFLRYSDEEIIEDENFTNKQNISLEDIDTSNWIITRRQQDGTDEEK